MKSGVSVSAAHVLRVALASLEAVEETAEVDDLSHGALRVHADKLIYIVTAL